MKDSAGYKRKDARESGSGIGLRKSLKPTLATAGNGILWYSKQMKRNFLSSVNFPSPGPDTISGKTVLVVLTMLCLTLVSCARKEAVRRTEPVPYDGAVTVDILKGSVGFGDVRTVKALAEVTILKKGKREGSLNGVFGFKAPGRIRLNLMGPFGLTVAEILISDNLLQFFLPAKNLLYEWNSPEVTFAGTMNTGFHYVMAKEHDHYLLRAFRSDGEASAIVVTYVFDRTYLLNRVISFSKDGTELIRAEFDDYNGRVPERTKLMLSDGLWLEIALQETEFDSDIADTYFAPIEGQDKEIRPFHEILQRFEPDR